jgi:uncharacterized protein with PQ loop repeat
VVGDMLGWCGAVLSCVISLPQVMRTIRAKQSDGISAATYWLVLANAAVWTAWSLVSGVYAAGVPALVNGSGRRLDLAPALRRSSRIIQPPVLEN